MSHKPIAVGLFLCEQVIIDRKTGNVTPVNCFTARVVERTIAEKLDFFVFALLTNGHGIMQAALEIDRLDNGESFFRREFELRFRGPLQQVRCILHVRNFAFPGPGGYQFSLVAGGEFIGSNRLSIQFKE